MFVIFIRSIIIFALLLIVMRLMGKRQIGEMQPFEFIITLLIAELACVPMADVSIPLSYGIVSVLAVFVIHQLFSIIEHLGRTAKKIISGKPSIVINKDGIDIAELKKNNLDVEDLIEALRGAGYFSLAEVEYAIFESNGKLSVMPKSGGGGGSSLPLLIISEGKLVEKNYDLIKPKEDFLGGFLDNRRIKIKDVLVMTVSGEGEVYFQIKGENYKVDKLPFTAGALW